MVTITRQQLVEHNACADGLEAWDKHFGASVTFDPESVEFWTWVVKSGLRRHVGWFCVKFGLVCNLTGACLTGADLCGADLCGADLCGANLTGANLTEADLTGADLYGADLTGANLTDANLLGANLSWADLTEANLSGADLPPDWREQVSAY